MLISLCDFFLHSVFLISRATCFSLPTTLFLLLCDSISFLPVQVAHFYNTIDQQMIPSQQAMMLEAAMAFEHVIKNPKIGTRNEVKKV